jgi:hypothetical protein
MGSLIQMKSFHVISLQVYVIKIKSNTQKNPAPKQQINKTLQNDMLLGKWTALEQLFRKSL